MEAFSYQKRGIDWMLSREHETGELHGDSLHAGGILADEVGLGKTFMSINTIIKNPKKNTLILAPKSLLIQWQNEFSKAEHDVHVSVGFSFNDDPAVSGVTIMSHSALNSKKIREPRDCMLTHYKWDRVIIDEAHAIKNAKSKIHKIACALDTEIRWALTATPVMNKMTDFVHILGWIGVPRHMCQCHKDDVNKTYVLRRTQEDVKAVKLPPLQVEVCNLPFSSEEELNYYKICYTYARKKIRRGTENAIEALEMLLRVRQTCCHPQIFIDGVRKQNPDVNFTDFSGPSTKMSHLISKIQNQPEDDKALVFCAFIKEMDLIKNALEEISQQPLILNGSMSLEERALAVDQFNNNPAKKVFIIQMYTGGTGYNFQVANHIYITSPTWNPSQQHQIIGRCHRTGQTKPVYVTLQAIGNNDDKTPYVEEFVLNLQARKRKMIAQVLQDHRINSQDAGPAYEKANKIGGEITFSDIYKMFQTEIK
jgi:SNF2 family DNA or RNA helicase